MTEFNLKELKFQRQRKELTIEEMAKKIGMKPSSYQKRENGNVKITMTDFTKILNALDIDEKDILIFFKTNVDKMEQN